MLFQDIPTLRMNENDVPFHATDFSAGADIRSNENVTINPGETVMVKTGIFLAIPPGYFGLLCSRSSLGVKNRVVVSQGVGVIDSDYRGEVRVPLTNLSEIPYSISAQDRIAQLVILPYVTCTYQQVDTLPDTERAAGGFGSTGK